MNKRNKRERSRVSYIIICMYIKYIKLIYFIYSVSGFDALGRRSKKFFLAFSVSVSLYLRLFFKNF